MLQGIGFALIGGADPRPDHRRPGERDLDDYKLLTIADIPEIVIDFPNVPDANLPNVGSKGLGEPPIVPRPPRSPTRLRMRPGAVPPRCR